MRRILPALLFLLLPLCARAAPAEIDNVIHADKPIGQGTYRVMLWTIYDASLWTDAAQWSMQDPFALTLKFHRGFTTDDFVSRAVKEMKHVDPSLSAARLDSFGKAMQPVFPDVREGDEITALYQPGVPVHFFRDGKPTSSIDLKGFAQAFFGIWLSPKSSAPGLRADLLGHK